MLPGQQKEVSKEQTPAKIRPFYTMLLGLLILAANLYILMYMEVGSNMGLAGTGGGPYPSTISLFANCIFVLVLITLTNSLISQWWPGFALSRAELLIIYVMQTIATAIVSIDFMDVLVPMMTYPYRMATPENEWETILWPHLKPWLTVSDPEAVKGWYEGNRSVFTPELLKPWMIPIACWSGCIFVMLGVMFCINVIVRQQWIEHDRLQFPIIELPMQITEPGHRLLKSRLMWIGFSISAFISIVNGLHLYYPLMPTVPVKMWNLQSMFPTHPWNAMGWTPVSFYPYGIGLAFLLPLDMLFSCWFFYLMWRVVRIIGASYGAYQATPNFPFMDQQALGAYYLVGIMALWTGRKHLVRVLGLALRGGGSEEEQEGPMTYRTAFLGVLFGTLALIVFFQLAGLWWWLATIAVLLYFMLAFAIARMHAEFGPPAHDLHNMGPEIVLTGAIGQNSLPPSQLAALSWFWWFNRAYRSIPIAYQLDGMKIAHRSGMHQRTMFLAMSLASVVSVGLGFLIYLHFGYSRGASVGMAGHVSYFGHEAWQLHFSNWNIIQKPPDIPGTAAIGWGMVFAWFLYMMKLNIAWWPWHPLGFAVSTSYSIGTLWMPIFIAWACKLVIIKTGGLRYYRVALDFFLGLLMGDFMMGTLWPILGWIFNIPAYSFMQ